MAAPVIGFLPTGHQVHKQAMGSIDAACRGHDEDCCRHSGEPQACHRRLTAGSKTPTAALVA